MDEPADVDATPSSFFTGAAAKVEASNGAAASLVAEGPPESLELAVASCMVALVCTTHLPMKSAKEPACAATASKANTALAVALRIPGFM
ncbi:MAG TPA: hypothetical protein VL635_17175 [Trinickia sp.]|nr:hypothetical protein [Trinickia sp.]